MTWIRIGPGRVGSTRQLGGINVNVFIAWV
ncbi:UNVERIFIED_ORG: hypothetical protein M2435_003454 [Rhizobium sophorae]|nr:hypothetical protein [Rhizobium leguminosarum]MDH6660540.1 hypothetical protein [Rhizobium sophorae]